MAVETWLPRAEDAVVTPAKITNYLLARDHPEGGPKAAFFEAFGFTAAEPELLAEALRAHPLRNPVSTSMENAYGVKHVVTCHLSVPDGRNPCVHTVWIVEDGAPTPRLVTAFPSD